MNQVRVMGHAIGLLNAYLMVSRFVDGGLWLLASAIHGAMVLRLAWLLTPLKK